MSALLLDTHIWLWYAEGNADRLPPKSVQRLDKAREGEGLRILSISVWEIGVLHAKGRIQLSAPFRDWVAQALSPAGISLVTLDADIAAESTLLPGEPHGDPADRFLIATARTRGCVLVTRDESIVQYGQAGYVRVMEL
jgi:PIN domain nuclease of toxin-antitoxin system